MIRTRANQSIADRLGDVYPRGHPLVILPSARLYSCARCRALIMLCSRCDRGRRYCGPRCARAARRASLRRAGQQYQATPKGQRHHAARQAKYRAGRAQPATPPREIVTHHSSPAPTSSATLPTSAAPTPTDPPPVTGAVRCWACRRWCQPHLRCEFLQYPTGHRPAWTDAMKGSSP